MAKTQKFTEDQLLDVVVKYAEVYKNKIKATELSSWASNNIEGLEEVRDYHFTRPIKKRDFKTGKMIERKKECTQRIEEINKSRSIIMSVSTNLLLRSANIDSVFNQPLSVQKKLVVETRETFDTLMSKNIRLERENNVLKKLISEQKKSLGELSELLSATQKKQDILTKQVRYIMRTVDEDNRRVMLSEIGIIDGNIDLRVYNDSLCQSLNSAMNINKSIRSNNVADGSMTSEEISEESKALVDNLLNGLID